MYCKVTSCNYILHTIMNANLNTKSFRPPFAEGFPWINKTAFIHSSIHSSFIPCGPSTRGIATGLYGVMFPRKQQART